MPNRVDFSIRGSAYEQNPLNNFCHIFSNNCPVLIVSVKAAYDHMPHMEYAADVNLLNLLMIWFKQNLIFL